MLVTPERKLTHCGKPDPRTCRLHGGRVVDGIPAPIDWLPKEPKSPKTGTGERQRHGFINEQRIVDLYDLNHLKEQYTHKWDAFTKEDTPIPVSIKSKSKNGSVEMGDFFRNADVKEDFYLHVTYWSPNITLGTPKSKLLTPDKVITSEHALLIPGPAWSAMFPQSLHENISTLIDEASNDKSYDETWKKKCAELKDKWEQTGSIIKLAPKRDHKDQKRMQCVIPYKEFVNMCKAYEVPHLPKGPAATV